jgi:hypothetical protein
MPTRTSLAYNVTAFFPESSPESICSTDDIGGHVLRPDERGYYDIVDY